MYFDKFADEPMTLLHKTAISNQMVILTDEGDARLIVTCMKKYVIFPSSLYDHVFATDVRYERMVRLLDSVQVLGDKAFPALMKALSDCSFCHLADLLKGMFSSHINISYMKIQEK